MKSELSEHFENKNNNSWQWCPRSDIWITGCSRYFICMKAGVKACMDIFASDKKPGMKVATMPETFKQIRFSIKQHGSSIKVVGVGKP